MVVVAVTFVLSSSCQKKTARLMASFILTDGWIAWPSTPPDCKCLTLTTGKDSPFGESVKIKV